ncbi:MAG: carboxypeptidase regulatory-like domain-containing protein, partial [Acidobacteria bacterium]|nr:carboxypeptidase regulatory-like domain-containing protein [Acidobacteriota bacterium]
IYRLPELISSGGAAGNLLNGWWVSGILSLQTGSPFSVSITSDRARKKGGDNRPDLVSGRSNDNIIRGGPTQYFDPTAFAVQPAGFLGTAGRNILRGPGFANLDFTLGKDTALGFLGENGKLEFRAEFFNILNRANFGIPIRTVYAAVRDGESPLANAGKIQDTANTSRQIQFALKIVF